MIEDNDLQQCDRQLLNLYPVEYSHQAELVIDLNSNVLAHNRVMELQVRLRFVWH